MKCGSPIFLPFASTLSEITEVLRRRSFVWVFLAAALVCLSARSVLGEETQTVGLAEPTLNPSATSTPTPTPTTTMGFTGATPTSEAEVEPPPLPGTTPTPTPIQWPAEAATPTPSPAVEAPPPIIPIQAGTTPGSPISRMVTAPGLAGPASAVPSGISLRSAAYTPLTISLALNGGLDENFRTTQSATSSWFTNPAVSLLYNLPGTNTQVAVGAGASFTYYLDQGNSSGGSGGGSQKNDIDLHVDSIISHSVSERLKLDANVYATYRTEPDLSSNVGFQNRQGNFIDTLDSLGVTYHWSQRFFTVTTDKLHIVDYLSSSQAGTSPQAATSQNRIENTIDQEFKYDLLHHGNTAVLEYRFMTTDYLQDSSLNSLTNFALIGFDQEFSPQLKANIRGGATIRSFASDGSKATPQVEGSLIYAGAHNSLLSWRTTYGIENSSVAGVSSQTTFRTGLEFQYGLTARIIATLSTYYNHSTNQGTAPGGLGGTAGSTGNSGSSGSRDAYDAFLNGKYAISTRWACNLGIEYSGSNSGNAGSSGNNLSNGANNYTRVRYTAGLSYKF